ncbi:hypothetical protein BX666DRAFT_1970287 [Dichotomocladium elegans]|nr:hypothetical protein BX666DRAFT_1970287 [Dichotomocladium elegans]
MIYSRRENIHVTNRTTLRSVSFIDSLSRQQEIEAAFCRDFRCCGQQLSDLHDLLHHYEEQHACTEDDNTDGDHSMDAVDLEDSYSMLLGTCYGAGGTVDPVNTTFIFPPVPQSVSDEDGKNPCSPMSSSSSSSSSDDEQPVKTPVSESFWPLPVYQGVYNDLDWLIHVNQALLSDKSMEEGRTRDILYTYITLQKPHDALFVDTPERPYKCEVQGCDKAYKNVNGLKYHKAHGHCSERYEDEMERNAKKPYHCAIGFCRKRYKNLNGLKYHIEHTHMARLRQQRK